ncbi:origin recognition complex subunit 1 [Chrysoperla carnea]|uniref:origin recognition complex subunit 1 n=1 Tax=Chrysoperla carnea TaxID=189513 RepID=UPI001D06144B|nr:origin recognition complex subunit 1 [Chrysoperla carnea]
MATRSGRKIKVNSYREMESDSESSPGKKPARPLRRSNRIKSYNESDSETENISIKSSPKRKIISKHLRDNDSDSSDSIFLQSPSKRKPTTKTSTTTPRTRKKLAEITEDLLPLNISSPKKPKTKTIEKIKPENTPVNRVKNIKSIIKTPNTPKQTPIRRRISFVIDSPHPMKNHLHKENTELDVVREKLHVSKVPESLPCRESEYSDIFNFVYSKLSTDSSGCMYVAGVPGTGKTATVTEVIRNLQNLGTIDHGDIPVFDYVNINGMRLTEPRQAYVEIYKQLTNKRLVWDQAYECLKKKIFGDGKRKRPIVLLVDELDIIHTKRQDVVYNILDWPSKLNSKIIIIAISNTMDLPERLLMGRVASRLGLTRLPFQPYNFKQLEQIVATRLDGINIFQSEAIQLVARKVAAVSGDARRALDICRRAAEIAAHQETTNQTEIRVTLKHVNEALNEMINSDQIKLIKSLTKIEKLFLQSIIAEVTRIGVEETSYQNVLKQFYTLCTLEGITKPACTILTTVAQYLAKQKMIVIEKSKHHVIEQMYLNVCQDDVQFALNDMI